ncbi:MAG: HAD family hydrolase [Dehalococcoidia bacterium]|nr:HAD family hydrolase [Dehalococcoidia bacterium]
MLKIVSLDMDGTLVQPEFVNAVWLEGVPRLYAAQYSLDIEEATRVVFEAYESVGPQKKEWYEIKYWFERFALQVNWRELMESCRSKISFYPEVSRVLEKLSEKYGLILVSNAAEEFIDIELEPFKKHFDHIFSCVSHFNRVKKDKTVYDEICRRLQIRPEEICHAGDHYEFDYLAPSSLGIKAYMVDRTGNRNGPFTVRDLAEFEAKLSLFSG